MTVPSQEQMKAWVRQWCETGDLLAVVQTHEVAALTHERALAQTRDLLEFEEAWRADPHSSGLVEQQALFQKLRPR